MARKPSLKNDLPSTFSRDAWWMLAGKKLGEGATRVVYRLKVNPSYVLKVEQGLGDFHNIREWEFWQAHMHTKEIAKWLAPCHSISPNGRILLQRYAAPIKCAKIPKLIPTWATDEHSRNWGLLDKRPVLVDYGIVLSNPPLKLKKRRIFEETE